MSVRMSHPEVDDEITVAESAVPFHAVAGWLVMEDTADTEQADDSKSSGEKSTSERSRARSAKKEQG